jgi:hypothetical protein
MNAQAATIAHVFDKMRMDLLRVKIDVEATLLFCRMQDIATVNGRDTCGAGAFKPIPRSALEPYKSGA